MMKSREARRKAFMKKQDKSRQISEGSGFGFFRQDLKDVTFWKCKEGPHDIDIVPYSAGPDDPDLNEGDFAYTLEVYEHRDVGDIEGQSFICLEKMYQKPCPICEYRKQLQKEQKSDDDVIKALRPNYYPRSLYNILVYDTTEEENKGVQVWHTSYYLMQRPLSELAKSSPRDIADGEPPYKYFADPEEGYSIRFKREGSGPKTQFTAHQLSKRKYDLSENDLAQAHQLDQLIHIPTYDEVYAAFWGETLPEEQTETDISHKRSEQYEKPKGRKRSTETTKKQVTRGRPPAKRSEKKEREFEPEDELPKSLKSKYDQDDYVCPAGGDFGQDTLELEQCDTCDIWEECHLEHERVVTQENADTNEIGDNIPEEKVAPKNGRRHGRPKTTAAKGNGRQRRTKQPEETEETEEDLPKMQSTRRSKGRPKGSGRRVVQ